MSGVVHSVNVSSGGVPKYPVDSANVSEEGVEGDFNRFRVEDRGGDPGRAVCILSIERIESLKEEGCLGLLSRSLGRYLGRYQNRRLLSDLHQLVLTELLFLWAHHYLESA